MGFDKSGKYVLGCDRSKKPVGMSSSDFLRQLGPTLLQKNHSSELIVVESEDGSVLSDMSYDLMKSEMRHNHKGKTVFPVIVNGERKLRPSRDISAEATWFVAVTDDSGHGKTYFYGDYPKADVIGMSKKLNVVKIPAVDMNTSEYVQLLFVIGEGALRREDKAQISNIIKYADGVILNVRGMETPVLTKGALTYQDSFIVTDMEVVFDTFDDIPTIVPFVNSVDDMMLWRNFKTGEVVPSVEEAYLMLAALFFMSEGFATFNLDVVGETGTGKCHGRGTKILMYDGCVKNVEDICAGDLLMGDDSMPRKVLSLARGREMMYRVDQNNGESYTVNESHILSLKLNNPCVRRTFDMPLVEYLGANKTFRRLAKGYKVPVEFKKRDVVLDPYLLGLWLGDGTLCRSEITTADKEVETYIRTYAAENGLDVTEKKQECNASSTFQIVCRRVGVEDCVVDRLLRKGESGESIMKICSETGMSYGTAQRISKNGREGRGTGARRNVFFEFLKCRGLLNAKRIPQDYIANSREVRLAVLAGIIDTDGYVANKCVDIVQKSKELADDVVFVARSLGLAASLSECVKRIRSRGFVGKYWRIFLSGDMSDVPCKVKRKKDGLGPRLQRKNVLNTSISVVPLQEDEYFGFVIDGNNRYLLGDCTVTHNTFFFDVVALQYGTTVHAMEQTTIKGLVFSHAEKGGQKGILFRESDVALLSEYMRVAVRTIQSAKNREDVSRLLSSMNDAVERKKNRSRSSGHVVDAEGECQCSLLLNDNYYEYIFEPFMSSFLQDPSYFRRWSFLRLSPETESRGRQAKSGVFRWRELVDEFLRLRHLDGGRWARMMRYWRSRVGDVIKLVNADVDVLVEYAETYKLECIRDILWKQNTGVLTGFALDELSVELKKVYDMLNAADFSQLACSCLYSVVIMNSTFRARSGFPVLEYGDADFELAKSLFKRLMDDLFILMKPSIEIAVGSGVRRTMRW